MDDLDISPRIGHKRMSAGDFVKICKGDMDIEGTEWADFVELLGANKEELDGETDSHMSHATFSNIEIEDAIFLGPTPKTIPHLSFSNCLLSTISLNRAKAQSINIENNTIVDFFSIKDVSEIRHIEIKNSKIQKIKVANSNPGFNIDDSEIGSILLEDESNIFHLEINNSSIQDFDIKKSTIRYVYIKKKSQIAYSRIEQAQIGCLKIISSTVIGLSFDKSKASEFIIWNSSLQRLEIISGSFVGYLHCQFALLEPVHLILENSSIVFLDFRESIFPEFTTVNIIDCKINNLTLSAFCNYGTVFFNDLKPLNRWKEFMKYNNGEFHFEEGSFQFKSRRRSSSLQLCDSELGKMHFINCDLRKFDHFEFSNTKILDIFVAGSHMPDDKAFCLPNKEQNLLEISKQKRLAYGQFKKIYELQGDTAGSLNYLAYEMDAYREQLKREKASPRFSKKWWMDKKAWDNRGERAVLFLNKYSTCYGTNWLRGFFMTLLAMSICFAVFCRMLGFHFGNDWEEFGRLVSYAPYYLNPLRDLDSVSLITETKEVPIEWYARVWDFLSRIIVAYFAYQTIQAFRKLGKSSG